MSKMEKTIQEIIKPGDSRYDTMQRMLNPKSADDYGLTLKFSESEVDLITGITERERTALNLGIDYIKKAKAAFNEYTDIKMLAWLKDKDGAE